MIRKHSIGAGPVSGVLCGLSLISLVACMGQSGDTPTQLPNATFLTDSAVHVPPTTGIYAYNTFQPGAAGFPAVGGTYVDPVFGGSVRRLTDIGPNANQEDIYGHHWANANGTYAFSRQGAAGEILKIISTATGADVLTNIPFGSSKADLSWDPIDPDKYYYFSGPNLVEFSVAGQTSKTIFTSPGPLSPPLGDLKSLGGSMNWIDRTGDLFIINWDGTVDGIDNPTVKLWRRSTGKLYSGEVASLSTAGWVAITPDGQYLVTAAGGSAPPNKEHYSYKIDHATTTLVTTPTQFWGLCGDHGALVSATNGKSYFVTFDCYNLPGLFRVDITLNQAGKTEDEQRAANQLLIPLVFSIDDGHLSGVSKAPNQNWVFFDSETRVNDDFNEIPTPTNWLAYEQEIMAINVITLEVRRYAHHRSRGIASSYYAQPRISSAWDGSVMLWTSNYNVSSPIGYADLYGMAFSGN